MIETYKRKSEWKIYHTLSIVSVSLSLSLPLLWKIGTAWKSMNEMPWNSVPREYNMKCMRVLCGMGMLAEIIISTSVWILRITDLYTYTCIFVATGEIFADVMMLAHFCGFVVASFLRFVSHCISFACIRFHFILSIKRIVFSSSMSFFLARFVNLFTSWNQSILSSSRFVFIFVRFSLFLRIHHENLYDQLRNVKWSARFDSILLVHWLFVD